MNVLAVLPHLASYLLALQPWDNMELFFDQSLAGIATGSIYGLVALASSSSIAPPTSSTSPRARWPSSSPSAAGP
jgi:hypothetical protein